MDSNESDDVALLIQEANANNRLAQAKLSLLYFEGIQVKQSLGKAYELIEQASQDIYAINKVYKKAAEHNSSAAEYGLHAMWSNGWGVPLNNEIASKHLIKSAELGFPRAMYLLGLNYKVNYFGLKKDLVQSTKWLKKAAENGIEVKSRQK